MTYFYLFGTIQISLKVMKLTERNYNDVDKEKSSELYREYQSSDNNIDIVKIGDSKNIEIGCYDGTSKVYLKDEAFTVTKK